jgi:hypothetical protein
MMEAVFHRAAQTALLRTLGGLLVVVVVVVVPLLGASAAMAQPSYHDVDFFGWTTEVSPRRHAHRPARAF